MDFRLIPICSEIDHDMEYKYKDGYNCDICGRKNISYRCKNCEYSRCSGCHRDILASKEISERLRLARIKNDIKLAELTLKEDGLFQWEVMVSNGEICYINKLTRTYSFDYPYTLTPDDSPRDDSSRDYNQANTEVRPKIIPETDSNKFSFSNIYETIRSYLP